MKFIDSFKDAFLFPFDLGRYERNSKAVVSGLRKNLRGESVSDKEKKDFRNHFAGLIAQVVTAALTAPMIEQALDMEIDVLRQLGMELSTDKEKIFRILVVISLLDMSTKRSQERHGLHPVQAWILEKKVKARNILER